MVVEVDLAVLPPHRVVELQRDVDELIAERVELVEPPVDDLAELVDAERAALEIAELDDRQLEGVHVHVRRLAVQQYRVPAAEPLHRRYLPRDLEAAHITSLALDQRPVSVNLVEEQADCGGRRPGAGAVGHVETVARARQLDVADHRTRHRAQPLDEAARLLRPG